MALNSIITNSSATLAVEVLNDTNAQLQSTQKQISTGYRVADATDDGAAYAVAQRVRSDVGALTTVNQQLGGVNGLLSVTNSALDTVYNTLSSARDILVNLANSSVQGSERTQYQTQYQQLIASVQSNLQDASYNGKTLIGNLTGSSGSYGSTSVVRNELGSSYTINAFDGSSLFNAVNFNSTQLGATTVAAAITATGSFITQLNTLSTAQNTFGTVTNYVTNQISYNSSKIDALNNGLGALVDADLTQESAQLQALQVRQQLGTQALSIANQAPQSLLKLFQ
jgi:flagellin